MTQFKKKFGRRWAAFRLLKWTTWVSIFAFFICLYIYSQDTLKKYLRFENYMQNNWLEDSYVKGVYFKKIDQQFTKIVNGLSVSSFNVNWIDENVELDNPVVRREKLLATNVLLMDEFKAVTKQSPRKLGRYGPPGVGYRADFNYGLVTLPPGVHRMNLLDLAVMNKFLENLVNKHQEYWEANLSYTKRLSKIIDLSFNDELGELSVNSVYMCNEEGSAAFYPANDDLEDYDCTTRPWYKAAANTRNKWNKGTTFTEKYDANTGFTYHYLDAVYPVKYVRTAWKRFPITFTDATENTYNVILRLDSSIS